MLLFVAQLIHVICTTVGQGVGKAKWATFQEIMSSLLPQADRKKSHFCARTLHLCLQHGVYLFPLFVFFKGSDI